MPRTTLLRPVAEVAADLGLGEAEVVPYGRFAAKVDPAAARRPGAARRGRLVLVTSMSPTRAGEGKTTTAVALVDALRRLGTGAVLTVRQASLGPVFGMKGGASGGGRAQVVPREVFNLHLTGDFHAVAAAHNLAAALLDAHLHHGNALGVEPASITWPRVVDANDRPLRAARIGLGGPSNGPEREAEWNVTAASEVMAALSLAGGLADLRRRLGAVVLARDGQGRHVTAEDLRAAGAMTALLVEAVKPNLMQTAEGAPVLVHTGPFGNIATGASSVIADEVGLSCADLVVTEAGFGAELGAEKFVDLKCRQSGLRPALAVLVATVRAVRQHGAENLHAQVGNVHRLGLPVVVAVNVHPEDADGDVAAVREAALAAGALAAVSARPFTEGGAGALDLARAVRAAAAREPPPLRLAYPDASPLREKIETVAGTFYGAAGVDLAPRAAEELARLEAAGHGRLPVCMAKTPYSLSHDPALGSQPSGYRLPVRDVRLFAGAGYVTAYAGDVLLMPGLPAQPAAAEIDVDADGHVTGLR